MNNSTQKIHTYFIKDHDGLIEAGYTFDGHSYFKTGITRCINKACLGNEISGLEIDTGYITSSEGFVFPLCALNNIDKFETLNQDDIFLTSTSDYKKVVADSDTTDFGNAEQLLITSSYNAFAFKAKILEEIMAGYPNKDKYDMTDDYVKLESMLSSAEDYGKFENINVFRLSKGTVEFFANVLGLDELDTTVPTVLHVTKADVIICGGDRCTTYIYNTKDICDRCVKLKDANYLR